MTQPSIWRLETIPTLPLPRRHTQPLKPTMPYQPMMELKPSMLDSMMISVTLLILLPALSLIPLLPTYRLTSLSLILQTFKPEPSLLSLSGILSMTRETLAYTHWNVQLTVEAIHHWQPSPTSLPMPTPIWVWSVPVLTPSK